MILSRIWNTWRRTIRFRLAWLVLVCVLPVWCAAGSLVYVEYQDKMAAIEERLQETARSLSLHVDRELTTVQAALSALATSPSLAAGDFAAFRDQAGELLKSFEGADIILADATGQQLVNSFLPKGSPLPKRALTDEVRRVFKEGKPSVTGLFKGAVTGRFLVGVDVPVFLGGKVAYDLAMTFPADRVAAVLFQQRLPSGWVGTIQDQNQVIVARALFPERFVGTRIPPLKLGSLGGRKQTAELVNLDNTLSIASISESDTSGWAVVVNVPKAVVTASLWRWVWWAVSGTILLSVAGLASAFWIGSSIARSIRALISPAIELASGNLVSVGNLEFQETDEVGRALGKASLLLKQRTDELERSNHELEEFAAITSHDLQEPLRKIKSFGERLREDHAGSLDETGKDFLRRMESAAGRMHTLVQDLLEYSRVTTRPSPFSPADLGEVARDALVDLEGVIEQTCGRVEIADLPTADVDVPQMRRVFQNLFSNALKYHDKKPPLVKVTGDIVKGGDGLDLARIFVHDNGIGFDERYAERIFKPFQRLHGRNKYEGTGIGLAVVKKVVERHGGTVSVRSVMGQGSTFIVDLPLLQPKA
jgi:signal transduction histidine kinase